MSRVIALAGFLVLTLGLAIAPAQAAAKKAVPPTSKSIAAVVNDDAISERDVSLRMRLIMVSSGIPDAPDIKEKIRPQIVNSLIEEKLMMQEAKRRKITVTDEEIEGGFKTIATQNNMEVAQFKELLKRQGINEKTLSDQIRSQIAWSKVVQGRLRPDISVSDFEISARKERLKASIGKTQYLISEIFLPVDDAAQEGNVKQLAERLVNEIKGGSAPFPRVASQFSQAATAAKGGDLGWVQEGQLDAALDTALAAMAESSISPPLRARTGYYILVLRKKDTLTAENMPKDEDIFNKLGLEHLERAQRRYLLDLKSSAFIDRRL